MAVYSLVSSSSDQMVPVTLASGSLDQLNDLSGFDGCGTFFLGTSGLFDMEIGAEGGAWGGGGGPGGGGGGAWDMGGGGGGIGPLQNSDERLKSSEEESVSPVLSPTACTTQIIHYYNLHKQLNSYLY